MNEKSAISKMVAYLENHVGTFDSTDSEDGKAMIRMCLAHAKALAAEEKSKPAPVEAKATAEGSLVEFPCPTCGAERFKTERRLNGDSWCRFGHKHPTKDFVRPASPAVEGLVRELREWAGSAKHSGHSWNYFHEILAKYDNAKGGK